MESPAQEPAAGPRAGVRRRLYEIIFEADTRAGRAYDIGLLTVIGLSVLAVTLDSVGSVHRTHGPLLYAAEWGFTALFTAEYLVRLWCVGRPLRYATSFLGVVDFLGVIPTYLSLLVHGAHYLVAIRFLRVLRIFRVLKLSSYEGERRIMAQALKASRRRIAVFLLTVLTLVVVLGALMYVIEGESHGFTSIPTSIYWAVVTLTTVGYGDISPGTPLGQAVAAALMVLGYSIIVVPTGLVSVEVSRAAALRTNTQACPECGAEGHDDDARFCKRCGSRL